MRTCPECDKKLATDGGLDVHMQMAHAAKPPSDAKSKDLEVVAVAQRPPAIPEPAQRATRVPAQARQLLRGYDVRIVVNALLVAAMLLAGVGVAIGRSSARTTSLATASAPDATTTTTTTTTTPAATSTVPAAPIPTTPRATTPLTQPPLFSQAPSHQSTPSTTAPQSPTGCQSVIDSLSSRASKHTVDAGDLMAAHTFPGPPIPGAATATVVDDQGVNSLAELAANSDPNDPDDQAMQQLLAQSGFQAMHAIDLDNDGTESIAVAFRFSTPAAALGFDRGLLTEDCQNEGMRDAKAIPGLTGAMSFVDDGDMPNSAAFVAGDTVVALGICDCANASQALAAQWAQAVATRLGAV